jgi:hypothetical protein
MDLLARHAGKNSCYEVKMGESCCVYFVNYTHPPRLLLFA